MWRLVATLSMCLWWAPACAGPQVALVTERAWNPSMWLTSSRHRSRVGARLGLEIGDKLDLELSGSWQPSPVYSSGPTGDPLWLSSAPRLGQRTRHNQVLAGVDLRYTPLRGVISLADEAVLPLQVSAVFGVRAARQRQLVQPFVGPAGVPTSEFWIPDPVLVNADLRVGPNVGAALSMDLNSRVTLRTDVQAVIFVLPAPSYDLNDEPGTLAATFWPSTLVSVAYRL